jgi:hypothetical protein
MASVQDLSDYHLQFMAITTWLIKKGQLCELGQKQAYIRAFPTPLLPRIITRLQFNFPKHNPAIPYPVTEVYNTAKNLLQGISSLGITIQVQPISAPAEPTESPIKTKTLAPEMAEFSKTISKVVKTNQQAVFPIPVQTIKSTYDERIATLEAELFNLKKATVPKRPTVSIPNSEPTVAENVYKRSMDAPITITQKELIVADLQPTYTAEQPFFTVKNITNRSLSEEKFISPVEIFSNTHKPAEKSDLITAEPIPAPSNYPTSQLQSTTDTNTETDYNNSITDNRYIFLPNITEDNQQNSPTPETDHHNTSMTEITEITDNNRQSTKIQLPNIQYLSTNSTPAENSDSKSAEHIPPPPISPKNHLQSNVTDSNTETEYNLSVNKLPYIYLPSTADDELSISQHQTTNDKITDQTLTHSNINRPLKFPFRPTNRNPRKPNVIPADILYISLFTDFDKSPD